MFKWSLHAIVGNSMKFLLLDALQIVFKVAEKFMGHVKLIDCIGFSDTPF